MPLQLPLPERLSNEGWKVKIRDRERVEPPHATVIRGNRCWRWDLRSRQFMDAQPDTREIPSQLLTVLTTHHADLVRHWDAAYPENPVGPREED
ncbi:MAG TPA: hypothetical protein VIK13_13285 [Candidatus Limnocylindrales bacterium]